MPDGQQQQGQDAAQTYLGPLSIPQSQKADAWDAYHNSANEDEFAERAKKLNLPSNVSADLWDRKHAESSSGAPAQSAAPASTTAQPQEKPSLLSRIGKIAWQGTPMGALQDLGAATQKSLSNLQQKHEQENLSAAANSKPLPHGMASDYALRTGAGLAGVASSLGSPESAAIAGAGMVAPYAVGPALVAHGAFKGLSALDSSKPYMGLQNPDTQEALLSGGAEAAGGAAMAGQPGLSGAKVGETLNRGRAALASKATEPLVYEGVKEAGRDTAMGVDPTRAFRREGITGSLKGMQPKIDARLGELKTAANNILSNHPNSNVVLDAGPEIDRAIDSAIGEAKKTATSTQPLEDLRTALKNEYGRTSGTPLEMNDLKSKIQRAANNLKAYATDATEGTKKAAMMEAARNVKNLVNKTVPEAAPLNERMADLQDAQSGISRNFEKAKGETTRLNPLSRGGIIEKAGRSAPVRTGIARLATLGMKEPIPGAPGGVRPAQLQLPAQASPGNAVYPRQPATVGTQAPGGPNTALPPRTAYAPNPPGVKGTGSPFESVSPAGNPPTAPIRIRDSVMEKLNEKTGKWEKVKQ